MKPTAEGMRMRNVYADYAATTRISDGVLAAMTPYLTEEYGNASSVYYSMGRTAKKALDAARESCAAALGARPGEIFFTSGGTEADNWAIRGAAYANIKKGRHIISSAIEHHAVLHTLQALEKEGFAVTLLPVDKYGLISLSDVENAIRDDTTLITIMAANNEIGTIQPIEEIAKIAAARNVLFHTDSVQAAGHMRLDLSVLGVSMASVSAHKLHGPKGVGLLYIKEGTRVNNLLEGGGQERSKRSGTENIAGIVGLGAALEDAVGSLQDEITRVTAQRDRLIDSLLKIPGSALSGHPQKRLPGIASFLFERVEGESMILSLDMLGISASSGSACSTASLDPSHVLMACGYPHKLAHGSLRLSIGRYTADEDIDYIIQVLPGIVQKLRARTQGIDFSDK